MRIKKIIFFTLTGFLWFSSGAVAAPCDCGPGSPGAHARMPGAPPPPPSQMNNDLHLTDEQKNTMDEIMKAEQEQTRELVDELMTNRSELMKKANDKEFDEIAVRSIVNKIVQIESELMFQRVKTKHQFAALLNDQQKADMMRLKPPVHRPMPCGPQMMMEADGCR